MIPLHLEINILPHKLALSCQDESMGTSDSIISDECKILGKLSVANLLQQGAEFFVSQIKCWSDLHGWGHGKWCVLCCLVDNQQIIEIIFCKGLDRDIKTSS